MRKSLALLISATSLIANDQGWWRTEPIRWSRRTCVEPMPLSMPIGSSLN